MEDLINLAVDFIENHFNEIDKYAFSEDFDDEVTKESLIKLVKSDDKIYYAWVLTELMRVGTENNYLKPYVNELHSKFFLVINVNGSNYKYIGNIDNSEPFEKITI